MAQMRRSEDASDANSLPNTEEKDGDGETTGYLKFTCKHCKGTPAARHTWMTRLLQS